MAKGHKICVTVLFVCMMHLEIVSSGVLLDTLHNSINKVRDGLHSVANFVHPHEHKHGPDCHHREFHNHRYEEDRNTMEEHLEPHDVAQERHPSHKNMLDSGRSNGNGFGSNEQQYGNPFEENGRRYDNSNYQREDHLNHHNHNKQEMRRPFGYENSIEDNRKPLHSKDDETSRWNKQENRSTTKAAEEVTEESMGTDFAIDVRANKGPENETNSTTMVPESRFLVKARSNCPEGKSQDRSGHCRDVF